MNQFGVRFLGSKIMIRKKFNRMSSISKKGSSPIRRGGSARNFADVSDGLSDLSPLGGDRSLNEPLMRHEKDISFDAVGLDPSPNNKRLI
jgi:hypothetical protein